MMEQIAELLMDCDQNPIFTPLLITKLETLGPFWAIFNTPTHQTSILGWEKLIILDQI
jgi:hypothetical protein